jgi:hypothetical protein
MKKTILWGALLTLICSQTQADNVETTTTTPATQPATQGTQPASPVQAQPATQPVQATPASGPAINCDYKIDASTKNVDQSIVISWSEKATTQSFDFDPKTLDEQMQKLQHCFTEQGWSGFNTALQKSGNLDAIKAQHLTVSSQIDGQTKLDEVKENQWKLTLPVQVVYQNDKEKVTQLLNIKVTISRKPSGNLGITQMIATPRADATAAATTLPTTTTPAAISPNTTSPAATTEATPATTTPEPKAADTTQSAEPTNNAETAKH